MAIVGYARVSTIGQNLNVQLEKLHEYGCDEIFEEKRSGRSAAWPARSTLDLHRTPDQLWENEVGFVVSIIVIEALRLDQHPQVVAPV